jgi:hypothetical protein
MWSCVSRRILSAWERCCNFCTLARVCLCVCVCARVPLCACVCMYACVRRELVDAKRTTRDRDEAVKTVVGRLLFICCPIRLHILYNLFKGPRAHAVAHHLV